MRAKPEVGSVGGAVPVPACELLGRTLGEFVVREKLGEGGFGAVFRAEQRALAREAVVKILQPRAKVGENAIQRFMREARLASTLDHPYAAHIYAFGAELDGLLWIAMELVRGTPLDKLLKAQGPLPLARFIPLFDRICEVVHTAHEQGIVHRDLKPANVMVLSRAGRLLPKLLDFGVAKLREESWDGESVIALDAPVVRLDERGGREELEQISAKLKRAASIELTERGLFIGSAHYMAPEQWVNPTDADPRSDLYALGVLCFEALTGRRPFEGDTVLDIARGHAQKPVPPPGADLPEGIHAFLQRAMAKRSAARFETALELASAFRAAAGIGDDDGGVPQLDEAVRETVIALAPQPLAESVSALEASRTIAQAREATAQVFRVVARYVGLVALACRTKIGAGASGDSAAALELLAALRQQGLSDAQWLGLARELCRPFSQLRDAYPIPELVSFLVDGAQSAALMTGNGDGAPELERELQRLSQLLRAIGFLFEYPLVVSRAGQGELWMGVRRTRRNCRALPGAQVPDGQALLVDGEGAPLVSLWPLVQAIAPTPGAPEELFLLEANSRLGAKLISSPLGFERHDESVWEWFGERLLRFSGDGVTASAEEKAPYLGLTSFTAKDAKNFFGREREAEAFANRLRVHPMLAVVGPSGAGKSSFIQAGVVPLLPANWQAITFRPGPAPLASLCSQLSLEGIGPADLRERLANNPEALGEALRKGNGRTAATALLVVDQFEELLTLCPDGAERNAFSTALVQAAQSADEPVRIVLTLRDDFLIRAQQLPALKEKLAQGLQLLATPAPEDLVRILINPGRQAGYEFEDPKLTEEMVREVAEQPGALALLSFTASKLWELRDRHFRHLSRRAYQSLGGVGGALAQHAEATLAEMPPEQRALVREAFRHLVTADRTRAVLSRREMEQVLGGGQNASIVLERLIGARLLTASEGEGAQDRIEVIHEALLTSWPRLVQWQQEDSENARMRHQLRGAARQWDERGRGKGLLWRKEALMEYRLWRSRDPGRLTEVEEAFAHASLAEETRGRRLQRAALVAVLVGLSVGLAVLYRANRIARENERIAQGRLTASYEEQGRQLLLSGDPLRGIVYLDRAMQQGADGPALRYLLGRATRTLDAQVASLKHGDEVREAHFSPDGKRVVTASADKTAKLWTATDGHLIATMPHQSKVASARFNRDGSRIVTASFDGTVKVWDGATGAAVGSIAAGEPSAKELGPRQAQVVADFSPDGSLIATASGTHARIWEAESLAPNATLAGHLEPILALVFQPDGKSLFTADAAGEIKHWNVDGTLLSSLVLPSTGPERRVSALSVSRDGRRLAAVGWDGIGAVWDARRGQLMATLRHSETFLYSVSLSPDGERVATAGDGRTAKVWSAQTGRIMRLLEGHSSALRSVTYSADGHDLLTTSSDGTARLWSADDNVTRMTLIGHLDRVSSAELSPDGQHMVTASYDGTAKIWDSKKSFRLLSASDPNEVVLAQWSVDGQHVLTVNVAGEIRLRDGSNGAVLIELATGVREVKHAGWSADETRVALASTSETTLFAFPGGEQIAVLRGHAGRVSALQFSPDSRLLATASLDGSARLWNAADGAPSGTLRAHSASVRSLAFDTTGRRLATGGDDKALFIWNVATGARLLEMSDFDNSVFAIAFSADGSKLATASRDKRLMIWSADDGRPLLPIHEATSSNVNSVHFTRDGSLLLTSDVAGVVAVWDVSSGRLLSADFQSFGALEHATRFSPEESRAIAVGDRQLVVWAMPRDMRSSEQISSYVRCRAPFRLEGERLLQTHTDPSSCQPPTASPATHPNSAQR